MAPKGSSPSLEEAFGRPCLHKLWEDLCPVSCLVFLLSKVIVLSGKRVELAEPPPHQDLVLCHLDTCEHLPWASQVERAWCLIVPSCLSQLSDPRHSPSNHMRQLEDELWIKAESSRQLPARGWVGLSTWEKSLFSGTNVLLKLSSAGGHMGRSVSRPCFMRSPSS